MVTGYHKRTMSGKRIHMSRHWRPYAQTYRRKPKKR